LPYSFTPRTIAIRSFGKKWILAILVVAPSVVLYYLFRTLLFPLNNFDARNVRDRGLNLRRVINGRFMLESPIVMDLRAQ